MYLSITSEGKNAILTWFSEFMSCRVIMQFVVPYITGSSFPLRLGVNFFFCLLACLFKKRKKKKLPESEHFALNTLSILG